MSKGAAWENTKVALCVLAVLALFVLSLASAFHDAKDCEDRDGVYRCHTDTITTNDGKSGSITSCRCEPKVIR